LPDALHHLLRGFSAGVHKFVPGAQLLQIPQFVQAVPVEIGHAEFFALIDEGSSHHHMGVHGNHLGGTVSIFRVLRSKTRDLPGLVVIAPIERGPEFPVHILLLVPVQLLEVGEVHPVQIEFPKLVNVLLHMEKLYHHIEFAAVQACELFHILHCEVGVFTDRHDVIV